MIRIETEKFEESVEKIKEKIKNKPDLVINRLPENTKKWFKEEFATEADFCGDYGMALKYLCDYYKGIMAMGNEEMLAEIEILRQGVAELKGSRVEEPKRTRLNG